MIKSFSWNILGMEWTFKEVCSEENLQKFSMITIMHNFSISSPPLCNAHKWMMLWIFHVVPSPNILSISSFSNRDSGFVQMLLSHQSKRFDGKIVLTWLIDIFGTDWRKHVFVTPFYCDACSYFFHLNDFSPIFLE